MTPPSSNSKPALTELRMGQHVERTAVDAEAELVGEPDRRHHQQESNRRQRRRCALMASPIRRVFAIGVPLDVIEANDFHGIGPSILHQRFSSNELAVFVDAEDHQYVAGKPISFGLNVGIAAKVRFAKTAKKNWEGFWTDDTFQGPTKDQLPGLPLAAFVSVATIWTETGFKMGVDPLIDRFDHGLDFVRVRQGHGEWLPAIALRIVS